MASNRTHINHSWDFASTNTKYYTHGIHPYPAMMIPQVARRIISTYGKNAQNGLDPFCGSGSVLLEFKLAGMECYGIDINPLALFISKVKNTVINPAKLHEEWKKFNKKANTYEAINLPQFFGIDFWFKKKVVVRLAVLKKAIDEIRNKDLRDFFLVCFSETVRRCSNTRSREFKLYRIPEEILKTYTPDVYDTFSSIFKRNLAGMATLYETSKLMKLGHLTLIEGDTTKSIKIPLKSIDLLVTSPPYGDSRTTVAYGQFSRLSLQWLGFADNKTRALDKEGLGGVPVRSIDTQLPSARLDKIISAIAEKDEKRARDVLSFFTDFHNCALEIDKLMATESVVCMVVGNRTVKGNKIPTDKIIAEFFKNLNYEHKKTIIRSIPFKRMPSRNSPTNVASQTAPTMTEEYIVILRKN